MPPALRPGDVVRVVAPSGPFEATLGLRGLGWLAERYRVRFNRASFRRHGYLAGSDARRREELDVAFSDTEARAIFAMRGGYGASRFAHLLDWGAFSRSPKWIVGFSDVTVLHLEAAAHGFASIHGPNLTGLARADARARASTLQALERPSSVKRFDDLATVAAGSAEGPLFGGNLTLLHTLAAAGRLRVPEGAVVLLEDVTEKPYRIDRMLTSLAVAGHFDRASAFVLGEFTSCDPGPDGVRVERVLAAELGARGVPVVAGLPVGHGARNEAVVLGSITRVEAGRVQGCVTVGVSC